MLYSITTKHPSNYNVDKNFTGHVCGLLFPVDSPSSHSAVHSDIISKCDPWPQTFVLFWNGTPMAWGGLITFYPWVETTAEQKKMVFHHRTEPKESFNCICRQRVNYTLNYIIYNRKICLRSQFHPHREHSNQKGKIVHRKVPFKKPYTFLNILSSSANIFRCSNKRDIPTGVCIKSLMCKYVSIYTIMPMRTNHHITHRIRSKCV